MDKKLKIGLVGLGTFAILNFIPFIPTKRGKKGMIYRSVLGSIPVIGDYIAPRYGIYGYRRYKAVKWGNVVLWKKSF